jgi:hypothetical protein
MLCIACGGVSIWIRDAHLLVGLPVAFWLYGIGGVAEKIEECIGFILACSFRHVKDEFSLVFVGVYGPNYDRDRRLLWE